MSASEWAQRLPHPTQGGLRFCLCSALLRRGRRRGSDGAQGLSCPRGGTSVAVPCTWFRRGFHWYLLVRRCFALFRLHRPRRSRLSFLSAVARATLSWGGWGLVSPLWVSIPSRALASPVPPFRQIPSASGGCRPLAGLSPLLWLPGHPPRALVPALPFPPWWDAGSPHRSGWAPALGSP